MSDSIRIVMVCLGNICRSPLAEVIIRGQAKARHLTYMHFSSAGTGSWHIGGSADIRSRQIADKYGLDLSQHCAQQITAKNISQWDWFIAMDETNYLDLLSMGVSQDRLLLMRQFESDFPQNVPDPYYGGADGFETVYQLLHDNTKCVLDHLEKNS